MGSLPVRRGHGNPGPLRRKAKLGQNFLVNPRDAQRIVDALGNPASATVLEIGAGQGVLTGLLQVTAQRLIAIELDRSLAAALEEKFCRPSMSNVAILCQDILSVDLTAIAAETQNSLVVVGNLPYYITSPILSRLFAHSAVIERAVLMVQREVADRIVAVPGSRDYGLLSATVQMYAQAEALFVLPPEAFSPPPDVHSSVVRLSIKPRFAELDLTAEEFFAYLRQAFALKRKTLANNLRAAGFGVAAVQSALVQCRLDAQVRAEAVPLEAMACLFHTLYKEKRWRGME